MTNFNSVVNFNITLNKIYLELIIPKANQSFTNVSTINKAITNKNKQIGANKLKLDKFGTYHKTITNASNNNSNTNLNNKNNTLQKSSKKETPIKVPLLNENDFKSLKEKQSYNNFSLNDISFLKGLKHNYSLQKNIYTTNYLFFTQILKLSYYIW